VRHHVATFNPAEWYLAVEGPGAQGDPAWGDAAEFGVADGVA
jgi:hypothetical protein